MSPVLSDEIFGLLPKPWIALVPISLIVIFFTLLRRGNKVLKTIRGPRPDSFLFGQFCGLCTISVADHQIGNTLQINRQEQAGDFDFACLKEYGPTWRIQECLGVNTYFLTHFYPQISHIYFQREAIMTADPKVNDFPSCTTCIFSET